MKRHNKLKNLHSLRSFGRAKNARPFQRRYVSAVKLILGVFVLVSSALVFAQESREELRTRHHDSISTKNGKDYEFQAAKEFWGDVSFLKECTQNTEAIPASFEIAFIVETNGKLGEVYFFPETNVAKCIRKNIINRTFSPPIQQFVGWINMSFK